MDVFDVRKAEIMKRLQDFIDKSPKGSIDAPIVDFVNNINHSKDFYTTSSCSGRISLYMTNKGQSKGGQWLLVEHRKITCEELSSALLTAANSQEHKTEADSPDHPDTVSGEDADEDYEDADSSEFDGVAVFRHEPFILSVECRNMAVAGQFLNVALANGFRESGLNAVAKRIVLSVRCSLRLEVPVFANARVLVSDEYLQYLVSTANAKFEQNRARTQRLADAFSRTFVSAATLPNKSSGQDLAGLAVTKKHLNHVVQLLRQRDFNNVERKIAPLPASYWPPSPSATAAAAAVEAAPMNTLMFVPLTAAAVTAFSASAAPSPLQICTQLGLAVSATASQTEMPGVQNNPALAPQTELFLVRLSAEDSEIWPKNTGKTSQRAKRTSQPVKLAKARQKASKKMEETALGLGSGTPAVEQNKQNTHSATEVGVNSGKTWCLVVAKTATKPVCSALKQKNWNNLAWRITHVPGGSGEQLMALPLTAQGATFCQAAVEKSSSSPSTVLLQLLSLTQNSLTSADSKKHGKNKQQEHLSSGEQKSESKCENTVEISLKLLSLPSDSSVKQKITGRAKYSNQDKQNAGSPPTVQKLSSPAENLKAAVAALLSANGVSSRELAQFVPEVPRKWELLGDLVLLPAKSFSSAEWGKYCPQLWETVARCLRANRVAKQQEIAANLKRESRAQLMLGNDGWVRHRENGIWYVFDATKSMFSSGNGTEKKRKGEACKAGETVVDLYAGIGYFTLPFLVHGKAAHVHACELNDNSVEALKKGLEANSIHPSRCTVYPGDNRRPAVMEQLRCVADRVSLGLLPSSEDGWPIAIAALKPEGGVLHVHANVVSGSENHWAGQLQRRLQHLCSSNTSAATLKLHPTKKSWKFEVLCISKVKWYAPRVRHIVVDIGVSPAIATGLGASLSTSFSKQVPSAHGDDQKQRQQETIPVVNCPSREQFWKEIVPLRKPVIIRGVPMGACVGKWDASYLQAHGPTKPVNVHVCPDAADENNVAKMNYCGAQRNYTFRQLAFSSLVSRISQQASKSSAPHTAETSSQQSSPGKQSDRDNYFISPFEKYYLRGVGETNKAANFFSSFPSSLVQDFELPHFFSTSSNGSSNDSIAKSLPVSSVFRLSSPLLQLWTHYDVTDNILCHVVGHKRVVMYPPDQAPNLYLPLEPDASSSPILDVEGRHEMMYPKFCRAQATSLTGLLKPGDILFIPALWFHNVLSLDFAVSINCFWRHLEDSYYEPQDVYGNRDLPAGRSAMERVQQACSELEKLPPYYQSFYRTRAMSFLEGLSSDL